MKLNLKYARTALSLKFLKLHNLQEHSFFEKRGITQIAYSAFIHIPFREMSEDESVSLDELEDKESDSEEMETKETEGPSFKCEYCGIVFQKHTKYIRHVRTHTKEVLAFFPLYLSRNHFSVHFQVVESASAEKTI